METKKVCWIRVFKNLSYCIAPIALISLILSLVSVSAIYELGISKVEDYYNSPQFAESYLESIYGVIDGIQLVSSVKAQDEEEDYEISLGYYELPTEEINGKMMKALYKQHGNNFMYIIIDNKRNTAYISGDYSVSYYSITKELKQEIFSSEKYWIYENGKVNSSIEKLSEAKLKNTNLYQSKLKKGDYTIYTAVRNNLPYMDSYLRSAILYKVVENCYDTAVYNIPISILLLAIMVPVVLIGIGKTRKQKGIYLTWFDKLSIELVCFALLCFGLIFCFITINIMNMTQGIGIMVPLMCLAVLLLIAYIEFILLLETVVKRIKTHTLFKTTFIYWVYKKIKMLLENMRLSVRIGIGLVALTIANWVIFGVSQEETGWALLLFLILYASAFMYILKRAIWREKINKAIEEIYKGNTEVRVDESEMKGELRNVALQINDIAGGLSNAVEERLKSERLKTELITNVSHDIKTPLTSIINYVDLLKKQDITTEKAAEYLVILDNKSQRLKKLTEDLLEASKASSGNIKLNMERLDVNELIKQISVEFEDKFKARKLEEIITFAEKPAYIKADSRYIYRVIENMYSNVSKYAMESSRVYTDIIEKKNDIAIQIKNISKEKLNITADELMQRFVRGDTSRNTEGSGLGLSIANSLTSLQNGEFNIYLDGDLFKITIKFHKI